MLSYIKKQMKNIKNDLIINEDFMSRIFSENYTQEDVSFVRNFIDRYIIDYIKKSLTKKSQDKKEYLKLLFKEYEKSQHYYNESVFDTLCNIPNVQKIEKVILFLKYKKDLNYKEKIKMIKSEEIDLGYLLWIEKTIACYNKNLAISIVTLEVEGGDGLRLKNINIPKEQLYIIIDQTNVLLNAINLIKCVVFDYYNYEIKSFDKNNKVKKLLIPNKEIFYANGQCIVQSIKKIDIEHILAIIKSTHKLSDDLEDMHNKIAAGVTMIVFENLISNEYYKYLLKEKYNEYVSNEIEKRFELNSVKVDISLFSKRKVLLPKNGVVLLIEDNPSIEAILLKEIYDESLEINNLIIITKYKNNTECMNGITLTKKSENVEWIKVSKNEDDAATTLEYIIDFFGIEDKKESIKYDIISPNYWKYRNKGYKTSGDKVDLSGVVIKREYEIEIAPFIRKIQGEPSKEAIKIANRLGVVLEKGNTIVRPHTRTYNKVSV